MISTLKTLSHAGATIVLSSQDMPFVKAIADKIIMLEDGKLVEEWNAIEQYQPNSKISKFMGFMDQ